jgi:hypothetical protein
MYDVSRLRVNVIHPFLPCSRPLTKEAPDRSRSFNLGFVVGKVAVA